MARFVAYFLRFVTFACRLMFSRRWNTSCPHFLIPSRTILCTAVSCHKSGSMAASKHTTSSRSSQVDHLLLLWFVRSFETQHALEAHWKQQATCSWSLSLAPRRIWWPRFKTITRCMLRSSHGHSTTGTNRCPRADSPVSQIRYAFFFLSLVFIFWRFVTGFDLLFKKIDDL